MASSKAYYWLALAVLALGLNNEYQHGRLQPLRNLVSRSAMTVDCVALRAREYVSLARVLMGGAPVPPSTEWARALRQERGDLTRLGTELAHRQGDFARLGIERAQLVRLSTEMARHQAQRAQIVVRAENIRKSVLCKDGQFRVSVDTGVDNVDDSPEVPDTF